MIFRKWYMAATAAGGDTVAMKQAMMILGLCGLAGALVACNQPNYNAIANRLREQTITQEKEIADLKETVKNRNATIHTLREKVAGGGPPLQTLPPERLAELFTAHSLVIRSETRVDTWEDGDKKVNGFRVFIRMLTKDGQYMPASGTLTIEAFELPAAPSEPRRIGAWTFGPAELKKSWYSGFGLDHFAMNCAFTSPPTVREIHFKARFMDALTGQTLEAQLVRVVELPL